MANRDAKVHDKNDSCAGDEGVDDPQAGGSAGTNRPDAQAIDADDSEALEVFRPPFDEPLKPPFGDANR